jgi:hypothetical protein
VDLDTGQRTQTWLAVSDDPAAMVSGRYWHHLRQEQPASEVTDRGFQDQLISGGLDGDGLWLAFFPADCGAVLNCAQQRCSWANSPAKFNSMTQV